MSKFLTEYKISVKTGNGDLEEIIVPVPQGISQSMWEEFYSAFEAEVFHYNNNTLEDVAPAFQADYAHFNEDFVLFDKAE